MSPGLGLIENLWGVDALNYCIWCFYFEDEGCIWGVFECEGRGQVFILVVAEYKLILWFELHLMW